MDDNKESLGERLKKLREKKGLTVKDVSDKIEVPITTYREWEHGRKIVGEPYIQLSKVFEISVYELITGEKASSTELFKSVEVIEIELKKIKQNLLST